MLIDSRTETQILVLTVLICLGEVNNNAITPVPITNKLLPLPPTTPAASNPSNKYDPTLVNLPFTIPSSKREKAKHQQLAIASDGDRSVI